MINLIKQDQYLSDNKKFSQWATMLSAFILVLITLDIANDYQEGVALRHLLIEVLILILSLSGVVYFGRFYFLMTQSKLNLLEQDLIKTQEEAQQWREANRELISGLSLQIQKQFDSWGLTKAETEVGMLMLKGLSHIEIAQLRNASERTIRDQARAVYRKSGMAGRSELSAFFLEDLLPPHE